MCVLQITLLLNNRTERFPPAQCFCLLFAQSSLRGKTKISHKGSLFTPLKSRKVSGLKLYWLWGGQLNRKIPECSIKREKNCLRNYCQNDMFWCSGWKDCVQRAVKPFICAKPKECCEDKQRIYPLLVSPSKGRETNTYLFSVLFLFLFFSPTNENERLRWCHVTPDTKGRTLRDAIGHQAARAVPPTRSEFRDRALQWRPLALCFRVSCQQMKSPLLSLVPCRGLWRC